jgi:hypothetical protein
MTADLPQGAGVLAYVDMPYLLDFTHYRIHTPYMPCYAFPAPGYSCNRPPEELVKLLSRHGIRYLIYSYRSSANFSDDDARKILVTQHDLPTHVAFARSSMRFNEILRYLLIHSPHLYDDGRDVVLDLQGFTAPGALGPSLQGVEGIEDRSVQGNEPRTKPVAN